MNKVTWQPSVLAWAVHWKDARSKAGIVQRFQVKGGVDPSGRKKGKGHGCDIFAALKSGEGDHVGEKDQFGSSRRAAYFKAIEWWNENDKSSRDRIVLES